MPASAARVAIRANRDQSGYTKLEPGGFPIRGQVKAVSAAQASLRDDEMVIGVVVGGEARAYPLNLMWEPVNEVLNDTRFELVAFSQS